MALIRWDQITSSLESSTGYTGSFNVTGSIFLNGRDLGVTVDPSIFQKTGSYYNATANVGVTGSFVLKFEGIQDYFSINNTSGSQILKVHNEGTLQLMSQSQTPTPVAGGIFYSSSDSFYFGFES